MSVTLNEVALRRLFESPESPLADLIESKAQAIVQQAQTNAARIMWRNISVVQDIGYRMEGTHALIGIRDAGKTSRYLAQKEVREGVWLRPALADVFGAA